MWVVGCCQFTSLLAIFPCLNEAFEEPVVCCSKRGDKKVPRVSRGSPGNQRKARVAAIVKIVEFPKENIGFQWSWWVPERPESGPRGHRNTPRAASGDQMDSWEVPGELPEALWRRFGSFWGVLGALFGGILWPQSGVIVNYKIR